MPGASQYMLVRSKIVVQRVTTICGFTFCLLLLYILLTAVQIYAQSNYDPCAFESLCLPDAHEGVRWRVVRSNTEADLDVDPPKNQSDLPKSPYYWVAGYGLTDMSHFRPSHNRMEEILEEMKTGAVVLEFDLGRSYITHFRRKMWGLYHVRTDLTEAQVKRVALAIAMDFVSHVEAHQSPGSSFSVEDLPSDYLGSILALNPEWTEQRLFLLLGDQRAPIGLGEVRAHAIKLFRKNYEFRAIPYPGGGHVNWPSMLRMMPASDASGLWESAIYVTPENRRWWQRTVDWLIQASRILTQ